MSVFSKKRTIWSVAIFAFSLAGGVDLFAQDVNTSVAFSRINYSGVDELASTLDDPKVRLEEKSNAVHRLSFLAFESRKDDNRGGDSKLPLSSFYNPILKTLKSGDRDHVQDHHILRIASCESLARFSTLEGGEAVLPALGEVLKNKNEHEEVRLAAAHSIARFKSTPGPATDQMIAALNMELARGPVADNVTVTTAIVNGIGQLQDKRAFVPLMQVIRSQFNADVKKTAQRALENISWK